MSAYTPGPWQISTENPKIIKQCMSSIGLPMGGVLIGSACGHESSGFYPTNEQAIANARLIAAAPELLEALVALFNDYKRLADSGDAGFWRLEDVPEGKQALAAIAKATGEQS